LRYSTHVDAIPGLAAEIREHAECVARIPVASDIQDLPIRPDDLLAQRGVELRHAARRAGRDPARRQDQRIRRRLAENCARRVEATEWQLAIADIEAEQSLVANAQLEGTRVERKVLHAVVEPIAVAGVVALAVKVAVGAFLVVARVISEARGIIAHLGSAGTDIRPVALVEGTGFAGPLAGIHLRQRQGRDRQDQRSDQCATY
jgi:hypothetical protein